MLKLTGFKSLISASLLIAFPALADDAPATPATASEAVVVAATPTEARKAAASGQWEVLPDKSSVVWSVNYSGKPVTGTFKDFTSEIQFDPEHLDQAHVTIHFDTSKVSSDDKDADQALPGAEWFDSAKNPKIEFEAKTFRHLEDEKYEADGTVSFGDKKEELTLPFTVNFYDDNETAPPARYAQVTGETTIKRTALDIGKGDWVKTDVVADDVKVSINLKAKSAPLPATP